MDNELDGIVIRQADTIARLTGALERIRDTAHGDSVTVAQVKGLLRDIREITGQAIALAKDPGQA